MTIERVLSTVDACKPNIIDDAQKLAWLQELEGIITHEIIRTHVGGENAEIPTVNGGTDPSSELLAAAPYDRLYPLYVEAQIDLVNGEIGKYNNSIALFTAAYNEYSRWYNRTHTPVSATVRFW
nr:MAG TPA: hypothetical protein [Caudoviricetes sp.]